jgi:aromatic-L-amino-acid decarboxylase
MLEPEATVRDHPPKSHQESTPAYSGSKESSETAGEHLGSPPGDMPIEDFRRFGHQVVDWVADYWAHPERYAVLPDVQPGALVDKLPASGPDQGEPMERILADFERQILPHVTHWNHPGFLAYFATSGSAPGVLAETLAAGLNNVGLLWKASPALAELEQVTLRWLADWMALPANWFGMIHTTASDASLHAVMAAREAAHRADEESGKAFELSRMTVYTSEQAHSSIEKTTLSLGLGRDACRKIAVDAEFRMRPEALETAIQSDQQAGLRPTCVVATVGTTSTSSVDPVPAIAGIAERHKLWLHVDAAYAGAAAILPEMREHFAGCDRADSFLVNPHKWLFTPMDLCAFYTRRPDVLREAFSLVPEYLRSQEDPRAVNLMEYAVPLGRRFRALKLWFILRYFGREGLSALLREHIRLAREFANRIDGHADFERMAPAPFSLVCFRYRPEGLDAAQLDSLNEKLLHAINASGEFFLSHTKLNSRFVIRMAIGNIHTAGKHLDRLWDLLLETSAAVSQAMKR